MNLPRSRYLLRNLLAPREPRAKEDPTEGCSEELKRAPRNSRRQQKAGSPKELGP
jgi:hypothetical protein